MQYVDYNNFLDVNVHTAAEELQYNNNGIKTTIATSQINEMAGTTKTTSKVQAAITTTTSSTSNEVIKKRGPGRPPGKRVIQPQKVNNILQTTVKQKQQLLPTSTSTTSINGDLNSHCSTDGIDGLDCNSSFMDMADYVHEQDEHLWTGFKRESNADVGDVGNGMGMSMGVGIDAEDDFDNQLLFMPPPTGGDSMTSAHNADSSGAVDNVRTVRRQTRGTAFCELCNKTFQYYSLYRNHMTKHSNETPFKCVLCKKGFKSKQAIRYHMHTHEKEKRHKCPLCHAAYYTENQVITHLLSHENGTIFPCMVCGKILRSDAERDNHLSTHTEERPYRCEYCNKLFRLRHHLSNHLKIHRQYRCDFCKSTFISALHQRKPYACIICSKHPHVLRQVELAQVTANSTANSQLSTSVATDGDISALQLLDPLAGNLVMKNCEDLGEMASEASSDNNSNSSGSSSSSNSTSSSPEENDIMDDELNANENENEDVKDMITTMKSESNLTAPWLNGLDNMLKNSINEKQRLACTYCPRTYSNVSALNYHIRQKHNSI